YLAVSISFGPNGSVGRCPKVTSHVVDFFFDESSSNSHLTGAAVTIRSHPARTMLHNGQQIKYYQRRECIGCWCPSWTSNPITRFINKTASVFGLDTCLILKGSFPFPTYCIFSKYSIYWVYFVTNWAHSGHTICLENDNGNMT